MVLDQKGRILLWNLTAEEISGYSADEVIGKNDIWKMLYPEKKYRNRINETITNIINEKNYLENFETTIHTKGGENKIISWNTKSISDEHGEQPEFIALGIDVTDRYLAEQKLQKSEERFRKLFLENVAGYALHEIICDSSGIPVDYRFLEINPAFERLTGLKINDIIGKKVLEVLPRTESYWIETYGQVALTGKSVHFENFSCELNRYYEVTAYSPIQGQFATLVLDITDRKKVEVALRESEERLRITLNATNDGIWDLNIPTGITIFSPRWYSMLGYFPDELPALYTTWESLLHPDDLSLAVKKINEHIAQKNEGFSIEVRMLTKQGNYKWVLTRGKIVEWDDKGKPIRMVGTHTDISDRKLIEEKLGKKHFELLESYEKIAVSEEELKQNLSDLSQSEKMLRTSEERLVMAQEIGQVGSWEYNPETDQIWGSAEGFHIYGFPPVAGYIDIKKIEACIPERDRVHKALVDLISLDREYNLEFIINPVDGSSKKIIRSIARIKRNKNGRQVKIEGVIQDITDLKKNEDALRETNAYLENLISIANVPIIIWDEAFRITRLNHAGEDLIGRSAKETIGHSFKILFPPDQVEQSMQLLQTTHDGDRWETVRIDIQHRNGSVRNVIWNSATLYTSDGITPVATIAQGRDITWELQLEKEKYAALVQIQKNLAQLAILNDEIRNPLSIIMTYADMFGDPQIIDQIIIQVRRIDEIVNHLDIRWTQSEKVLNAIRKHYRLYVSNSES